MVSRLRRSGCRQQKHSSHYQQAAEHVILHRCDIVRDSSRKGAKTKRVSERIPRACPVDFHDCGYIRPLHIPIGCHGLVPWRLTVFSYIAGSVKLHGTSPWHRVLPSIRIYSPAEMRIPATTAEVLIRMNDSDPEIEELVLHQLMERLRTAMWRRS